MDFLVTLNLHLGGDHPALAAAAHDHSGPAHLREMGALRLFHTGAPQIAPDGRVYLFDGQLAAGGRLHHPLLPAAADLPAVIDAALNGPAGIDGGVYCLGRLTTERLDVLTDPLNQYPVFWTRFRDGWAVSNRFPLLAVVLDRHRLPATRSLEPCVESMVMGGVGGTKTHIEQIRTVAYGERLVADRAGLRLVPVADDTAGATYREALDAAGQSMSRHVEATAAATSGQARNVIADITGGADSRCVLSFLRQSSLSGELGGRCLTRVPNADAKVAAHLMGVYGIPLAEVPDVSSGSPMHQDELAIRQNAAISGGARDAAPMSGVAFPDVVHFKGAFGELGGSTAGSDYVGLALLTGEYTASGAARLLIETKTRSRALQLLTEAAVDRGRRTLVATYDGLQAEGYPVEHLTAETYLRARARSHFGILSALENRARVVPDILADRWLVAARRSLPAALHTRNQVIFDLTVRNDPALAFAPMADKRWSPSIVPADLLSRLETMQQVGRETPGYSLDPRTLFAPVHVGGHPSPFAPLTAGGAQVASTMSPHHRSISAYQGVFRFLLDAVPRSSTVWEWFDRSAFEQYVTRTPEDFLPNGVDVATMGRASTGIMWYLGHEVHPHTLAVVPFAGQLSPLGA